MNLGTVFKIFDTVASFIDSKKEEAPREPEGLEGAPPAQNFADRIETRLTNVVVAALKEAFDRDHARLELERAHLEEQRRRAEEEARLEVLRRQIDREIGRLRLLAAAGIVGWIASVALLVIRIPDASMASRSILALGSMICLGAVGAAFAAQSKVAAQSQEQSAGGAALALLLAGLALTVISCLL
jgi:hypothetical protein